MHTYAVKSIQYGIHSMLQIYDQIRCYNDEWKWTLIKPIKPIKPIHSLYTFITK